LLYFNTLIKCILDDFEKAKRKLKKSEVHTDLTTDVEKEKKSRKKRKKKTNVSSSDNSEPEVMSAIKIKPFPKPQPSTSLPQSLFLNESSLQCSFENEFGGNANNIDWGSSFIIADTNAVELDDHQSFIQVSSPTCDNMALLNASEDPLIKSAGYNKTRSKLPEMSDKGI